MTVMTLIACIMLVFFGLNIATVGWFVIRFGLGRPVVAILVFNAVLVSTSYAVFQIAVASI